MLEVDAKNELNTQIQYRLIEKLTQSERRYRELVENLREIVFECDRQGNLTFLNRAWKDTLGYETKSSLGQLLSDFIESGQLPQWTTALQQQTEVNMVLKFLHHSGHYLWLELSMRPCSHGDLSGSLIDITERRQAATILQQANEELEHRVNQRTAQLSQSNQDLTEALEELQRTQGQLIQTEKMSSLGQLVAGIAHEINNPVNFVYGNIEPAQNYAEAMLQILDLYQTHYPEPDATIQNTLEELDITFLKTDFPKLLRSVKMGAKRIQDIVLSLRNFSRLDEAAVKTVNIHDGIENTLLILNSRLKETACSTPIQLIKHYGNLPSVECFPGELNQVFMNILANAIDALSDRPANRSGTQVRGNDCHEYTTGHGNRYPTITIETGVDHNHITISIADNGPGIPEAHLSKLFDPFFTTKPVGQGTGLGLSISHQVIAERHRGTLTCHSTVGLGTTFIVEIPLTLHRNE